MISLWFVLIYLAQRLLEINNNIVGMLHDLTEMPVSMDWTRDRILPEVQAAMLKKMKAAHTELGILGLRFTRDGLSRFAESLDTISRQEAVITVGTVRERFYDELSGIRFLYVEESKLKFYDQQAAFGDTVAKNFPSADYDVQEAANCFALGRYTACVMHSMRVLEAGLDALARALKVKRSGKSWGADLNVFTLAWQAELKANPRLSGWKRQFFPHA